MARSGVSLLSSIARKFTPAIITRPSMVARNFFGILLLAIEPAASMLYAMDIIARYDHKGGMRVTKEVFAQDLNTLKSLAENGFQTDGTCSHDLCVAPADLEAKRRESERHLGYRLACVSWVE